jgi:hypothetical protein
LREKNKRGDKHLISQPEKMERGGHRVVAAGGKYPPYYTHTHIDNNQEISGAGQRPYIHSLATMWPPLKNSFSLFLFEKKK